MPMIRSGFVLLGMLLALPALAQDAPTLEDMSAAAQILSQQRDGANNQIVGLQVKLNKAQAQIVKLQAELDASKAAKTPE